MDKVWKIGVIVPVYNAAEYLRECVDSVLAQGEGIRLYLVDDGSVDESPKIVDSYAEREDVSVIHQENRGLIGAWMRGLEEAKEPYIAFLDADDWLEPGSLSRLREELPETGVENGIPQTKEIVCASYWIERTWNGTREEKKNAAAPGRYEGASLEEQIKGKLLGNEVRTLILSRCMKLIDRRLLADNLAFADPSVRMGEDVNIMVPAILDADAVTVVDESIYHYRFVSSSMAHGYDPGLLENVEKLAGLLREIYAAKGREKEISGVERERIYLLFLVFKNEIRRRGGSLSAAKDTAKLLARVDSRALAEKIDPPEEAANRLLYFLMKRPGMIPCLAVRLAFLVHDRRG